VGKAAEGGEGERHPRGPRERGERGWRGDSACGEADACPALTDTKQRRRGGGHPGCVVCVAPPRPCEEHARSGAAPPQLSGGETRGF